MPPPVQELGCALADVTAFKDCFSCTATVTAVCNCRLLIMDRTAFRRLLGDFPGVQQRLAAMGLRYARRASASPCGSWTAAQAHAFGACPVCRRCPCVRRHAREVRASGVNVHVSRAWAGHAAPPRGDSIPASEPALPAGGCPALPVLCHRVGSP